MRHDKDIAFKLRRKGKTYRQIEKELNVSRSTLCEWFRNEVWSDHITKSNTNSHIKRSTEHLIKLNEGRKRILEIKYNQVEIDAANEFEKFKTDPLFMAGLMLYAGEGDRLDRCSIRFANIDFDLHKIFLNFIDHFMNIDNKRIKFGLLLYPDLNVEQCKKKWSSELKISQENFHKPQVIFGKHKTRRLHFGVGTVIISDSFLKRKLLYWINKAKKEISI